LEFRDSGKGFASLKEIYNGEYEKGLTIVTNAKGHHSSNMTKPQYNPHKFHIQLLL
jgi:hypothetical protein